MQLQCPPPTDVVRWIALWWLRQCSCPPTPASAVPSNCTFCTAPICKQDLSICLWRSSCKWAGFFYVCIVLNFLSHFQVSFRFVFLQHLLFFLCVQSSSVEIDCVNQINFWLVSVHPLNDFWIMSTSTHLVWDRKKMGLHVRVFGAWKLEQLCCPQSTMAGECICLNFGEKLRMKRLPKACWL